MSFFRILWDSEEDPNGNVEHIAEHGLAVEDVEEVLASPTSEGVSRSSGLPLVWGYTPDGIFIVVVYQQINEEMIRVVTAYQVDEP